jgi:flagellar FliJ protein
MPRRFHLQPLLDLTQNHTDVAARRLNQLKGKWNDAEEKLGQLIAFREEYRQRYQNAASHGMSMTVLREYQVFLGKLEAAVTQQTDEVVQCHKLSKRHHQGELRRESKIEQREQDEFAAQAFTRKIKKQEEDG